MSRGRRQQGARVDGILVVDKPSGPTSHDVVARVRRLLGAQKVGHTGTLDPMATGVLPLVLGETTKLARYLTGGDKGYLAHVVLGTTTDTYDREGAHVASRPVTASAAQVTAAVAACRQSRVQIPPMYSAKKIDGQKLYKLARQGTVVEREAKPVVIHRLDIVAIELPEVVLEVTCSAGTYVRVIAHDLGERLGCGAHLGALRRTRAGPFVAAEALPWRVLDVDGGEPAARATAAAAIHDALLPGAMALGDLPQLRVPPGVARRIASGYQLKVADLRALDAPQFRADQALTVASDSGELVAIARTLIDHDGLAHGRRDDHALRTERVLAPLAS